MQDLEDRWRFPEGQETGHIRKGRVAVDQCALNEDKVGKCHYRDGRPNTVYAVMRVNPSHSLYAELVVGNDL